MLPHVFVRSGYFGDDLKAQRRLSYMTPVLQGIVWTGTMLIGLIGLALVQGLPTSETELIIPYIVKNFVVSFNPVLAKILMVAFFIGASAVGLRPPTRSSRSPRPSWRTTCCATRSTWISAARRA